MSEEIKGQPKKSVAEMEAEMKALELEAKQLEVAEKRANLQDLKERLEERQLRRETLGQRSKINAATLKQTQEIEGKRQSKCTHKKGGNGLPDFVSGNGQSPQYAVIKHIMLNGDTWVRCMRCGKTWKPPLEEDFYFDGNENVVPVTDQHGRLLKPTRGAFSAARFEAAVRDYESAVNFPTNNQTSSSYMFKYSDGGLFSRHILRPTTLR